MADLSIPVNVFVLTRISYDIDRRDVAAFQVLRVYLDNARAQADLELVQTGEGDHDYKLDTVPLIVK